MEPRKERILAYSIALVLFLVGVVSYAAYPDRKPESPPRVMLKNTAGPVLLHHKEHAAPEAYAVPCMDCHHEMDEPTSKPQACGECHTAGGEDGPKRSEVFHQLCIGCHNDGGIGPVQCAGCHMM